MLNKIFTFFSISPLISVPKNDEARKDALVRIYPSDAQLLHAETSG